MIARVVILIVPLAAIGCSGCERRAHSIDRILAISFPGIPNPPASDLVRGTGDFAKMDADTSAETQISQAFLRCGMKQLTWTSFATDGASRLIMPDNESTRSAVKCVAKTFPWNFYARPERASKADLRALSQDTR
jgi:hypothetical protein